MDILEKLKQKIFNMEIKKGDTVYHSLSGLYYICENKKHEKWMNENKYYSKSMIKLPEDYHKKNNKK